jgi:DNA-binding transcriptional LysR family regulator
MQNRALEMEVFVCVADSGSFSNAAEKLSLSPSAVSKLVARLEQRLGVQLVVRSTRSLRLTSEGEAFHSLSRSILQDIAGVEAQVARQSESAVGILKISCNVPFGIHAVCPLIPRFLSENTGMKIDLELSDEPVDLILERTDLAIRTGILQDSSMKTRRLSSSPRHIVASPEYLRLNGVPLQPDDLKSHNCLTIAGKPQHATWNFRDFDDGGAGTVVSVAGNLAVNDGESLRRFALVGHGIARLSEFHIAMDIADGRLVSLLTDYDAHEVEPISAIYSAQSHVPQRIRRFLDFLVAHLAHPASAK